MRGRCRWSDPPIETRRFQVAPSLKINKKKLIVSPQTRLTSARIDRNRMKRIRKSNQRHYWVLPSSYRVFVDFTSYYEFFFDFEQAGEVYRVFTGFYRLLPGFLSAFVVLEVVDLLASLPSFTGFSQTRAECVWFDILPSFAKSKTFHNSTTIDINNCL